jgi:hypothetical protein
LDDARHKSQRCINSWVQRSSTTTHERRPLRLHCSTSAIVQCTTTNRGCGVRCEAWGWLLLAGLFPLLLAFVGGCWLGGFWWVIWLLAASSAIHDTTHYTRGCLMPLSALSPAPLSTAGQPRSTLKAGVMVLEDRVTPRLNILKTASD